MFSTSVDGVLYYLFFALHYYLLQQIFKKNHAVAVPTYFMLQKKKTICLWEEKTHLLILLSTSPAYSIQLSLVKTISLRFMFQSLRVWCEVQPRALKQFSVHFVFGQTAIGWVMWNTFAIPSPHRPFLAPFFPSLSFRVPYADYEPSADNNFMATKKKTQQEPWNERTNKVETRTKHTYQTLNMFRICAICFCV